MRTVRGPTVSTVLVVPLAQALSGSALTAFYEATDLTAPMLTDAEARISPAQFCVAWAEAERLTKDVTLALGIAERMPVGAFGIVEYVCRSAPTLEHALTQWVRYLAILDDAVEVGLVPQEDAVSLRVITESEAPAPGSHELCFALVARRAAAMLEGRFAVREVRFAHRARGPLDPYRAFFDAPVVFGAPHTELVIDRRLMSQPIATRDATLLSILVGTADERLARRASDPPLTDQVRRALRVGLCQDEAQLEEIAEKLGLTARSLQRRLRDEGTSFQVLRDDARQRLADEYLARGHTIAEVSFLLGFSEPSAFFRAFKRWTGVTPVARRFALGR